MQHDHKRHKATLEYLSEKLDLPITKIIDLLEGDGVAPGDNTRRTAREFYKMIAGFEYVVTRAIHISVGPLSEERRLQRYAPTINVTINPALIIRDLLADLGPTFAEMPSVQAAYNYLEKIEPPATTVADNIERFNDGRPS